MAIRMIWLLRTKDAHGYGYVTLARFDNARDAAIAAAELRAAGDQNAHIAMRHAV